DERPEPVAEARIEHDRVLRAGQIEGVVPVAVRLPFLVEAALALQPEEAAHVPGRQAASAVGRALRLRLLGAPALLRLQLEGAARAQGRVEDRERTVLEPRPVDAFG